MATITYDSTDPDAAEFTEEEQNSIAIGEQLAEQEQALLAGKFTDAEQLEKAYVELQRKLGSQDNEPQAEEAQEEEAVEPTADFLDQLWDEAISGEYTQQTLDQLQQMDSSDLAQMYLDFRSNIADAPQTESEVLSSDDVDVLQNMVGGSDSYGNMMSWAKDSLSDAEIDMYDAVMDKGDPAACFFAVSSLASRYGDASVGTQGELVGGRSPAPTSKGYRSQAEVVADMHDPRYDNDPAYRDDVMQKLAMSEGIMF
jgi:hypothetical protein